MTYEEQLKDERWLYLRNRILDRDWRVCQHCLSGKDLHVHHRYYDEGKMAWEYPELALITLCKKCHEAEHEKHGPCPDDQLLRRIAHFRHILQPARIYFKKKG